MRFIRCLRGCDREDCRGSHLAALPPSKGLAIQKEDGLQTESEVFFFRSWENWIWNGI